MNAPSEKEMHELNLFCAGHVIGWELIEVFKIKPGYFAVHGDSILINYCGSNIGFFCPTTDAAAALQVLEKCAKRCTVEIQNIGSKGWMVWSGTRQHGIFHETLEIGIVKFARSLFEK